LNGTHEELYDYLRAGKADVIISDLRQEPSEQYVNFFLMRGYLYAELLENNLLTQLEFLTVNDLKNTQMILIAPQSQLVHRRNFFQGLFWREERIYFRGDFGGGSSSRCRKQGLFSN